jgi:hypothetical protein
VYDVGKERRKERIYCPQYIAIRKRGRHKTLLLTISVAKAKRRIK